MQCNWNFGGAKRFNQIFDVLRAAASGALGGRPGSRGGTTRMGPTHVAAARAIKICPEGRQKCWLQHYTAP